jgi:hypothetical protein
VRDAILQAFYALRETFLEELDLDEPDNPLTAAVARRLKQPGVAPEARRLEDRQMPATRNTPHPGGRRSRICFGGCTSPSSSVNPH